MPLLMLKDLPRYDCLLAAGQKYPTLNPRAFEAFLHLLRTGDAVFAAESAFLAQHSISQGRFTVLMLLNRCGKDQASTPAALAEESGVTRATMGSCGSQTTFNSVRAVLAATDDLRDQLLDAASEELEAARDDLELVGGSVRVKGSPDKAVTVASLAAGGTFHGKGAGELPEGPSAPAEGCVGRLGLESFHAPQLIAHAAHVKVDRETGVVRVLRVAAAHDCGTIINRIGAEGQV